MSRNKQLKPLYKKKRSRLNDFDIFSMVFVGIFTVPLGVYLLYKHYDNEFGLIFGLLFVLCPLIVLWDNKRSPEQKARDDEEAEMFKTAAMIDYLASSKKKTKKKGSDSWLEQTGGHVEGEEW